MGSVYYPKLKYKKVEQLLGMGCEYTKKQLDGMSKKTLDGIRARMLANLNYQQEWYFDEDSFVESMKPNQ